MVVAVVVVCHLFWRIIHQHKQTIIMQNFDPKEPVAESTEQNQEAQEAPAENTAPTEGQGDLVD